MVHSKPFEKPTSEATQPQIANEIQQDNPQSSVPTEKSDSPLAPAPKPEQTTDTEKKISKTDEIFTDLLEQIKDRPEAQQQALTILLEQMRQIANQMKEVRDLKHLQEMKELMLKNWEKLNELAGGDQELLKVINAWGNKFNQEKVVFYDRINEVKDELTDQAQKIQADWLDMQSQLGEVIGKISNIHPEIRQIINKILYERTMDLGKLEEGNLLGWRKEISGLEKFIESINNLATGFSGEDIAVESVTAFSGKVARLISELSSFAYQANRFKAEDGSPIDRNPEIRQTLEELQKKATQLSENAGEASKIYKVTLKIRDTHFLPIFNQPPNAEEKSVSNG